MSLRAPRSSGTVLLVMQVHYTSFALGMWCWNAWWNHWRLMGINLRAMSSHMYSQLNTCIWITGVAKVQSTDCGCACAVSYDGCTLRISIVNLNDCCCYCCEKWCNYASFLTHISPMLFAVRTGIILLLFVMTYQLLIMHIKQEQSL